MIALQRMLLQFDAGKLRLLPASPTRWNVRFNFHAPGRTIVEAEFRDGNSNVLRRHPPDAPPIS
jgi:hypothetical protein